MISNTLLIAVYNGSGDRVLRHGSCGPVLAEDSIVLSFVRLINEQQLANNNMPIVYG